MSLALADSIKYNNLIINGLLTNAAEGCKYTKKMHTAKTFSILLVNFRYDEVKIISKT